MKNLKTKSNMVVPIVRAAKRSKADGRTKKAWEPQPRLMKWKCSICVGAERSKLLGEEKGRDHLSAEEINEVSFDSREELQKHFRRKHK